MAEQTEQNSATDLIKYGEGTDPFVAYASAMGGQGKMLKFSKGDYIAGEDAEEVPAGTRFIANIEELTIGWVRWENDKPAEHITGRIADSFKPPRRDTLGYTDESEWKVSTDGKPIDPWQFVNYLPMVRCDDLEQYTFATSSRGGLNATGKLAGQFGRLRRNHKGEMPVIALDVGSYVHDSYGRIKFPVLKIVDWQSEGDASGPPAEKPSTRPSMRDHITSGPQPTVARRSMAEMDDDIPFAPEVR